MKENGASEKHMTNELQTVLYYAVVDTIETSINDRGYISLFNDRQTGLNFQLHLTEPASMQSMSNTSRKK
jgi:hypothetical protein